MSTLARLKTVAEGYLQLSVPSVVRHPLLNNGTATTFADLFDTLFLQAANNARKFAELTHDFQCAEVSLEGVIPTTGVGLSWDSLTDPDDGDATASLRSMTAFFVVNEDDDSRIPVSCKQKGFLAKKEYDRQMRRTSHDCRTTELSMFHHKRKFYCQPLPTTDINIVVDGYKWFTDYSTTFVSVSVMRVTGTLSPDATEDFVQQTEELNARAYYVFGDLSFITGTTFYPNTSSPAGVIFYTGTSWILEFWGAGNTAASSRWYSNEDPTLPSAVTFWLALSGGGYIEATGDPTVTAVSTVAPVDFSLITDYFLTHGFAYMQWATIVELNNLIQRFVNRQEGSLAPPTKERDIQLALLINNDVFATESGDYHDTRDD